MFVNTLIYDPYYIASFFVDSYSDIAFYVKSDKHRERVYVQFQLDNKILNCGLL